MNDYTCEKCEEKDRIIENNEQRIADYISYIKKNTKHANQKQDQVQAVNAIVDNGRGNQSSIGRTTNCISTQTDNEYKAEEQQSHSSNFAGLRVETNNSQSSLLAGGLHSSGAIGISKDGGAQGSNSSLLRASHQILLNNYLRQLKIYLDNVEDQESEPIEKMKARLD